MESGKVTAKKDLLKGTDLVNGITYTTENVPPFAYNRVLSSGMSQTTGVIYSTVVNEGETFYYVGGKVYTEIDKVKALPDFAEITNFPEKAEEIRALGIKVFEEGRMYYTYFIKDQNYKLEYETAAAVEGEDPSEAVTTETKYHAVYRNSVYNLTVNTITNIGDDIPGGGKVTPVEPNPDIDPNEQFIDVTVTINPWVLNDIGIDL